MPSSADGQGQWDFVDFFDTGPVTAPTIGTQPSLSGSLGDLAGVMEAFLVSHAPGACTPLSM
jgi:hypothetical protein